MNKYIAVAVALVVVGLAFWGNLGLSSKEVPTQSKILEFPSLGFSLDAFNILKVPGYSDPVGDEAFSVFSQYLVFAENHDREGIRTTNHQISEACADESRREECYQNMDNFYRFTSHLKREDFTEVYADDRQVVLATDTMDMRDTPLRVSEGRAVLYFTRDSEGNPKMLGVKFCKPGEVFTADCFETDPQKRDLDGNGWWDQIEVLFNK